MKRNKKPVFTWNEETGIAECYITNGKETFCGKAICHPDDMDMKSEKVGCELAYHRAIIKALTHERDCVIKPSIRALKQLYYSMNCSKKFNSKSYENKMLQTQLQIWEIDLDTINDIINNEKATIKDYIMIKETMYQTVRKNRNKGQK